MVQEKNLIARGSISNDSGRMWIIDPSTARRDPRAGIALDVVPGPWHIWTEMFTDKFMGMSSNRVARAILIREMSNVHPCDYIRDHAGDVPVDGGILGFLDEELWPEIDDDTWENTILKSENINRRREFHLDDYGWVTSTGFGDGSYEIAVRRDHTERVVAIVVEFIDPEDEEWDN